MQISYMQKRKISKCQQSLEQYSYCRLLQVRLHRPECEVVLSTQMLSTHELSPGGPWTSSCEVLVNCGTTIGKFLRLWLSWSNVPVHSLLKLAGVFDVLLELAHYSQRFACPQVQPDKPAVYTPSAISGTLPLLHDAIPEAKQCAGLACRNLTHVLCIQYSHNHPACSYFLGDFSLQRYSLGQVGARS